MEKGAVPGVIIITGPKHSGKTSAGRAAAAILGTGFTDLDEFIEQLTGKSPRTLYKEGPEVFRAAETLALERLLSETVSAEALEAKAGPRVVAAGGGLIDNPAALELLRRPGTIPVTVFLELSAETAWDRINASAKAEGELPPFLSTENPRETHAALHQRRGRAYKEFAAFTIQADKKSPEAIGREIAALALTGLAGHRQSTYPAAE
ncbi:shikimate kinase [Treponema primitia]|nr:shikimate kinase [Treponema primitia]